MFAGPAPWFGDGCVGVGRDSRGGVVPVVFERVEQLVFHGGGNVGVGLDDSVIEVVAEPSCLDDFGNTGGDEPVLWLCRSP